MHITSIEPTPSPNSMKINLSESLEMGKTHNFKKEDDLTKAPLYVKELLHIEGVKSLYQVADFIALDRHPKYQWEEILPKARAVFGEESNEQSANHQAAPQQDTALGEVQVQIQMFRGIPMQIKLIEGETEERIALPAEFMNTAMEASKASDNIVKERQWVEHSPRYGELSDIGHDVREELIATYKEERLQHLLQNALNEESSSTTTETHRTYHTVTLEMLEQEDWKERYAALDRMNPTTDDFKVLEKALEDEKASVRRLATVLLGMIEDKAVLPYLYKALQDPSVTVRRTAGDTFSDLGFREAIPAMTEALKDKNKLVRWRAAMFLYEVGDDSAVPALQEAVFDSEFEVRMQAKMALRRIEGGEEAKGSVWNQMTQATQNDGK
ncbi:PBS lyase [Pontibacillus halophilus JSM 076056 = DSM 19796]|uniref:PBS lyase n=1 Tax=Pontibacillus halophilus JSM 076056 = DSM 19796 TaxID=1385510 RepID=A0A0A5GLF1_9BACI|nr:conserved virulence factor C family protein [Pontibacillus halophilus]KGX91980.1 PBS lyase [Pontibacillus halophilus JSM 076056 = DSM 19796]